MSGTPRFPAPSKLYDIRNEAEFRREVASFLSSIQGLAGAGGSTFTQAQADLLYASLTHTHAFSELTSKPTTISGYGITNAYTKTEVDAAILVGAALPTWISNHPDAIPTSPNAANDEFNDATNNSGPINGLDGQWTWRNQGTSTLAYRNDCVVFAPTLGVAGASGIFRGIYQGFSGASRWRMRCTSMSWSGTLGFNGMGFYLRESGTGKVLVLGFGNFATAAAGFVRMNGTSDTVEVGGVVLLGASATVFLTRPDNYLEIECTATNVIFRVSIDGVIFEKLLDVAFTTFFTTAPDQIGIGCYTYTATQMNLSVNWFRKVA